MFIKQIKQCHKKSISKNQVNEIILKKKLILKETYHTDIIGKMFFLQDTGM